MSDNQLKEMLASLIKSQEKTDEQLKRTDMELRGLFKKTDEKLNKVDARLDRVAKQLGGISNNQGDVAEEYFVNSLNETLKIGKIDFDVLIKNFKIKGKNIKDEYDILLVNGSSVAIIEVKYKVHPNDVNTLPKKIKTLKSFAQYKNYKVYAGIAGFYVPDEAIKLAQENGFFTLQRKGNIVVTNTKNMKAA